MKVAFFHNPKAGEGSLHAKDIIRRLAAASTAQPVSAAASERGSDYDDYLSLLPWELQRLCLQKRSSGRNLEAFAMVAVR